MGSAYRNDCKPEEHYNYSRLEVLNYYAEEIKHFDTATILYPFFLEVHQQLEISIKTIDVYETPQSLAILGPSRSGKTKILKSFVEKYSRIEYKDHVEIPVLYCSMPASGERGAIAPELIKALGDPFYSKHSTIASNIYRLCDLLIYCKVRLIIIDEIQHIVDRDRQKIIRTTADIFKQILDSVKIPIVFSGLRLAENIFLQNEQLDARVRIKMEASAFECNNIFRALLEQFDQLLSRIGLIKSGLSEQDFTERIFIATGGYIGNVHDLIREAIILAYQTGAHTLSLDIFENAFNNVISSSFSINPFDKTINVAEHRKKRESEVANETYGALSNRRTGSRI